jgi:hypothetical protein
MTVLGILVLLSITGCTTTHSVYVSNGDAGRAGPKAVLDADAEVSSEIIGVQHDHSMVEEVDFK